MKSKDKLHPKVIRGGAAIPLGDNFFYMKGRKHKDGGIDIGKNPKTGIEVEDGELMHLTNKEVKVFSSVPFLAGKSPAERVLNGDNPNKIFNAQESFKDNNNIKDDGTTKTKGDKNMKKFDTGGNILKKNKYKNLVDKGMSITNNDNIPFDFNPIYNVENNSEIKNPNLFNKVTSNIGNIINKGITGIGNYYKENPDAISDTIGIGSNIIGGLLSNGVNNRALNKMQYSKQPIARQATKLKTTININPQLDKMRETVAAYETDINNNTGSSRVALARKQKARVAGMLDTNQLYGNKENLETELINQDKFNQQRVADANLRDYNEWEQGKAAFNNTIAEKRSENTVGLVETLNAGVQDVITRGEKRNANKNNMLAMAASHPNVNPRILKELGVNSITDKMVEDWDKANVKKSKKSKS